jgi:DNA-directed RNA polymerase sigma subunit (sigma70/sigma32)
LSVTDRESESHQEQPGAAVVKAEPEFSGESLALFLAELARYRLLTAAEEVALAKRIERGDTQAKESLVNSNLRLVVSIAKRVGCANSISAANAPIAEGRTEFAHPTRRTCHA